VKAFYSSDNGATWQSVEFGSLGGGVFQGSFPNASSGQVQFYLTARDLATGTEPVSLASGSPKNASETFPCPANLLAQAADEPSGDIPYDPLARGYKNDHDLTGAYLSFSQNRLYAKLTNLTGTWSENSGGFFPEFYYAYIAGLANPDNPRYDVNFAMVNAKIPLLGIDPGLYKIDNTTFTFTKIGSIQINKASSGLSMSCALSDLTNDPDFGPNPSGTLAFLFTIGGFAISGEYWAYDITGSCLHYRDLRTLTIGENIAPILSGGAVSPPQGVANLTDFNFSCVYTDADNHLPTIAKLHYRKLGGQWSYLDLPIDGYGFSAGQKLSVTTKLPAGVFEYYFEFSDGMATARYPVSGVLRGPRVVTPKTD
jgi:hypothetical protein